MLLKNYYRALTAFINGTWGDIPYINVNGATQTNHPGNGDALRFGYKTQTYYVPSMYYMATQYGNYAGVIIGTGTTPPTVDDYALSGDMITTYSHSATVTRTDDANGSTFTGVYTITNTGESEFAIGEIALMAGMGNGLDKSHKALIERTVLEHPITIAPGGIGQVTYTIRMNYPV